MIQEPARHPDSEDIHFDVEINGHQTRIIVGLNDIEDYLGRDDTTPDERLAFVSRNKPIIVRNVTRYLGTADDIDGIRVTQDLLDGCSA